VFQGLAQRGWPLLLASGVCGLGAILLLRQHARVATRLVAALAVAAILWGWGIAQYPFLLPTALTIADGAGAPGTLQWLLIVFVAAAVLVVPTLVFVFRLDQKSQLECPPLEVLGRPGSRYIDTPARRPAVPRST
jgi:cytochrome d ubiquinol oxidase subunit II